VQLEYGSDAAAKQMSRLGFRKTGVRERLLRVNLDPRKTLVRATKTRPTCANLAQLVPTYVGALSKEFGFFGLFGLGQVGFEAF
jgi:hypothetical protein